MLNSVPGSRAHGSDGFVHIRLAGPVEARAYTIGNAVRMGNLHPLRHASNKRVFPRMPHSDKRAKEERGA